VDVALFDYDLPADRIAQDPPRRREDARLMVLPPGGGAPQHASISGLPEWLTRGDLLVFNDTRVEPARLHGRRPTGGRVELLVLPPAGGVTDST
jgi:S-adenosylmethionine:tRNA ribosyltransferase-isomerase